MDRDSRLTRRQKIAIAVLALSALLAYPIGVVAGIGATPVGAGVKYTCQTSAPAPINTHRSWVRCSDGHLIDTNASNVDTDLTNNLSPAAQNVFAVVSTGVDVASTGAGAQSTLITSYQPTASGFFRIQGTVSVTTTDTVTVNISSTDAINNTAQSFNILSASVVATNGTKGFTGTFRVNTATAITVTITVSSQATTKFSAYIERAI